MHPPENGGDFCSTNQKRFWIVYLNGQLQDWLSEQDLIFLTQEFGRTGFQGGLARYRNLDRISAPS